MIFEEFQKPIAMSTIVEIYVGSELFYSGVYGLMTIMELNVIKNHKLVNYERNDSATEMKIMLKSAP